VFSCSIWSKFDNNTATSRQSRNSVFQAVSRRSSLAMYLMGEQQWHKGAQATTQVTTKGRKQSSPGFASQPRDAQFSEGLKVRDVPVPNKRKGGNNSHTA